MTARVGRSAVRTQQRRGERVFIGCSERYFVICGVGLRVRLTAYFHASQLASLNAVGDGGSSAYGVGGRQPPPKCKARDDGDSLEPITQRCWRQPHRSFSISVADF